MPRGVSNHLHQDVDADADEEDGSDELAPCARENSQHGYYIYQANVHTYLISHLCRPRSLHEADAGSLAR